MTPFKQLYGHDPANGIFGDCYRTAIGCLLDMPPEQVPHFYDGLTQESDATEANNAVRYWLSQQGYALVTIAFENCTLDDLLYTQRHNNPKLYYLISGKSGAHDCNHIVVACGGQIVWDPSKKDSGISGPNQNNQFIIEFLVPASMTEKEYDAEVIEAARRWNL